MLSSKILTLCNLDKNDFIASSFTKGNLIEDRIRGKKCAALLEKGTVEVYSVSADGNETLLSLLKPGTLFGISNLFIDDELRTLLICREDCIIRFIPKEKLRAALLASSEAMQAYMTLCNGKLQFLLKRIEQLSVCRARTKLAEYLLDDDSVPYRTKESIAAALGISRAALYREIAYFESEGCIDSEGGKLHVIDKKGLETFAGFNLI